MDFIERLNRANGRLKAAKVRVRLQVLNQMLYARGTFPPAPGSTKMPNWVAKTARAFNRLGFCQAYHLRHSCARRCLEFGYSPEFGAKLMGRSPETHCKVYRRWIDEPVYRAIYEASIERGDRPQAPTGTREEK